MDLRMRKLTNRDCPTSCLSSMFAYLFKHVKQVQTLHFHSPMLVSLSCLTLGSFVHGILQAKIMEWVATGFLIQGIFTTQVLNLGLLPCRQILYHLSHYGSPNYKNLLFSFPNLFLFTSQEMVPISTISVLRYQFLRSKPGRHS